MSEEVFASLSGRQQSDLRIFAQRLAQQNRSLNLVAPSTVSDLWQRHIVDSLQIVPLIRAVLSEMSQASVIDIGTGGGLPAVPLAIAFAQSDNIIMQAIDSDRKKIASIRIMTLGLEAPLVLHDTRVEHHKDQHDVVTSRALAPLSQLLVWGQICLKPSGVMVLLKGERFQDEIAAARDNWNFSTAIHTSVTNSDAAVVVVSAISRKNA